MRTGISRLAAAVAMASVAGVGLVSSAPAAYAAGDNVPFTTFLCYHPAVFGGGENITWGGSSFQFRGVQTEVTDYLRNSNFNGCNGGQDLATLAVASGTVTLPASAQGSGYCIDQMGGNSTSPATPAVNFCGTDVPYTDTPTAAKPNQWENMTAAHGPLQTVPVALGAVAVSYDETCAGNNILLSGDQLSKIYSGAITTWNQIASGCPADTIVVLTRNAGSGTTAAFKDYLWKSEVEAGNTSNPWPLPPDQNPFGSPATSTCPVTGLAISNNQAMATCIGSNGSLNNHTIGYVDYTDSAAAPLWRAQVDNGAGTFSLPGNDPVTGLGGCTEAALAGDTPLLTLADWAHTTITRGPVGYGICTYTYQLAFQFGALPALAGNLVGWETATQAWEVGALISREVSSDGQQDFINDNYEALPPQVDLFAQVGAALLIPN